MEESICNQHNWSASKIYKELKQSSSRREKSHPNTKRARPDNTLNKICGRSVGHGRKASSVMLPANEVVVKMEHECWKIWAKRTLVPVDKILNMEDPYKTELWNKPVVLLLSLHLQELKSICQRDTCTSMFIATQFTFSKVGNSPECPSADVWVRNLYHIYTEEYCLALKRRCCRCVDVDESERRGTKGNKSNAERKTWHDLTSMTNLIKLTLWK